MELRINTKVSKYLSCIIFFFLIFSFSFSFVIASSSFASVPDICLEYNTTHYIWLEDYFTIDNDEVIKIKYSDPVLDNRTTFLPVHYASLNRIFTDVPFCYDVGYHFDFRYGNVPGEFSTDKITLAVYDDDCGIYDFEIEFVSDNSLDQEFSLTIAESCSDTSGESEPAYYNYSDFETLVAHFTFDNTLKDYISGYALTKTSSSENLIYDDFHSIRGSSSNTSFKIPSSLMSSITSDNNFSISFWYINSSHTGIGSIFQCDDNYTRFLLNSAGSNMYYQHGSSIDEWFRGTVSRSTKYQHLVFTANTTTYVAYINNTLWSLNDWPIDAGNSETLINCFLNYGPEDVYFDDVTFFDSALSASEVSQLWNSGNGYNFQEVSSPHSPSHSTIPNINMSTSAVSYFNYSSYFGSWDKIYITFDDPIYGYSMRMPSGYHSSYDDHFDVDIHHNGSVNFTSYQRSYNVTFVVSACNVSGSNAYDVIEHCSNETFILYISGDRGNVTQSLTMLAYYNLGFTGSQPLNAQYFFRNFDTVTFSFPDSNFTGLLNSSLPFSYTEIEDPVYNATYMVFINCSIFDSSSYVFLGDLNVSVTCGPDPEFLLTAYNNYNQRVYMTVCNPLGCISDYSNVLAGGYNYTAGQTPSYSPYAEDFDSDTGFFDEHIKPFTDVLPTDMEQTGKNRLTFVLIFVLVVVTFISLMKISVKLAIWACIAVLIVSLFAFSSANYISPAYPVLLLSGLVVFLAIKFIRGGS